MSLMKSFVKFVSDTKPVTRVDDLEEGRAGAEGVIHIGEDGPLISPVHGRHCVAFYYKAFHLVGARGGIPQPRKLRTEEVYHSFEIELEDGKIVAVPKKTDAFSADEHKELSGVGYDGFKAIEDLVSPGMRVRIFGTARQKDGRWVLTYTKLELVEDVPASTPATPAGKKKKKKSKRKAR